MAHESSNHREAGGGIAARRRGYVCLRRCVKDALRSIGADGHP
ncbi:hypothetical protein AKJ09_04298 [Labilithrix luteola]|uniref:Uncharacterized protein n=1 Tax=Labilithrix luteola TaxID=1391654 RepID=A0A0K1PWX1_9BACT|nr:hypothetical protein AKJ09_04298 [Labilithrix luteola]